MGQAPSVQFEMTVMVRSLRIVNRAEGHARVVALEDGRVAGLVEPEPEPIPLLLCRTSLRGRTISPTVAVETILAKNAVHRPRMSAAVE
jgi:hypothetical protein